MISPPVPDGLLHAAYAGFAKEKTVSAQTRRAAEERRESMIYPRLRDWRIDPITRSVAEAPIIAATIIIIQNSNPALSIP